MKKTLLILLLTSLILNIHSQTFVSTSPENKNIVLEEYTGIYCGFCPQGHKIAQDLHDANPSDVVLVNIHTGSYANPGPGDPDFRTQWGDVIMSQAYAYAFPSGSINRHDFISQGWSLNGGTGMSRGKWDSAATMIMGEPSCVNVAAQSSIDIGTRELTVNVEAYYTDNSNLSTNKLNVALLQNKIEGPQSGSSWNTANVLPNGNYNHMHMLRHLLTGQWGESIDTTSSGTFISRTYTYTIPADLNGVAYDLLNLDVVVFVAEGNEEIISGSQSSMTYIAPPGISFVDLEASNNMTSPSDYCAYSVTPSIKVTNNSSVTVNSFDVSYSLDSGVTKVSSTISSSLAAGASMTHDFPPVNTSTGLTSINYYISATGNFFDSIPSNNYTYGFNFNVLSQNAFGTSHLEDFEGYTLATPVPDHAVLDNPDNNWAGIIDPTYNQGTYIGGFGNSANSYRFRFSTWDSASVAAIIFDKIDLSTSTFTHLSFSYAYAQMDSGSSDKLDVLASKDCGVTWTSLFSKSGSALATVSPYNFGHFYPQSNEWILTLADLSAFDGEDEVLVKFEATSAGGNNLYIDDIGIGLSLFPAPHIYVNGSYYNGNYYINCGDELSLPQGYTYKWNTGALTQQIYLQASGNYFAEIYDTLGNTFYSDTVSIIINNIPQPTINISSGNLNNICGDTVSLDAGLYTVSYAWSTGEATQSVSIADSGSYYVIVTDSNGCSNSSDTVSISFADASYSLAVTANPQWAPAPPFAITFTNSTPDLLDYNFTWDFGDGNTSTSSNQYVYHQYQYNGSYDVTLRAEHKINACIDMKTYDALVYCSGGTGCTHTANIHQTGTLTACDGESVLLSCDTDPAYTYQWRMNGISISGATVDTFLADQAGVYSVMVSENGCPMFSQTVTISVISGPAKPSITATGNIAPCTNDTMTLTAPSGSTSYLWSNGGTTQSIDITTSGSYIVSVYDNSGCYTASDPYSVNASNVQPPDICVVTVDSATGSNMVVWEKPSSTAIDSFYIYKESNVAGVYDQIGAQSVNDFSTFVDNAANPMVRAYRYQIAIVDSCGNFTAPSSHHLTIHLTINMGLNNSYNLIWTPYTGFSYGTYNIYRGTSPSNLTLLTSIASSYLSYTDLNPPTGTSYYQIEVINPGGCNPTMRSANYAVSRSNIADNGVFTSISEFENGLLKVYPNPFNKSTTLEFTNDRLEAFDLNVYDMLGNRVRRVGNIVTDRVLLEKGDLTSGIYFIELRSETITLKGKVLVE